jgi:gas vesicle protein
MRNSDAADTIKDWVRLAAKLSLLFTEPKVRKAVGNQVRSKVSDFSDTVSDRYSDVSDAVSSKYDDAVGRLEAAADAIQGKSQWPSHVGGFLLGVGVGAGIGILLAPAAGSETRESVRAKASDVKDRVIDSFASATGKIRDSVTSMPSTGTQAY